MDQISKTITIGFNDIFTFINEEDQNEYILTYNMNPDYANIKFTTIWRNTISVHRKKQTNTIYSLNAMNELIKEKCCGQLDKNYNVDWSKYENSFLIIKNCRVKIIPIRLVKLNQ